jgi:hypothetical protein
MSFLRIGGMAGLMAALGMAGCTQERPYEEVYKEEVLSRALVDTTADYIYVPSDLAIGRSVGATRPNWQGSEKLVRLAWEKDALRVIEQERDPRFAGNPTNGKPVLSIPVSYVDYRCAENDVKECSNREEENNEIPWTRKRFFKIGSTPATEEVNVLPIDIENLFGSCYSLLGSRMVSAQLEADGLNIEVEKTYRSSVDCASSLESLSELSFTVRQFYSMIRVDRLASQGYQPVKYPRTDENAFGFFTTEWKDASGDNSNEVKGERVLMNRWNPGRGELVYYLNEPFKRPEYARIRAATQESVDAVNAALASAGAGLRIRLQDAEGRKVGDLRHNMIALVEDPQATGVIGYGPSVANPLTGEIVNARVVMYLGTMKKFVRWTYEELRQAKLAEQAQPAPASSASPAVSAEIPGGVRTVRAGTLPGKAAEGSAELFQKALSRISPQKLRSAVEGARDARKHVVDLSAPRDRLATLSKYCAWPAEYVNFSGAVRSVMASAGQGIGALSGLLKLKELKPWDSLSDAEQLEVIDALLPYVWVPTLVHEIGHNLGLRHNFAGSEDKENFYAPGELQAKAGEPAVETPFSSTMDYPHTDLNMLRVMGKYDVAALRFAYRREVEKAGGGWVKVDTTLADLAKAGGPAIKDYGYCTDEHVDVNPNCKRFDEGTDLEEIARKLARSYEESHARRNFRNQRASFSLRGDPAYAAGVDGQFMQLRVFFERYESLSEALGWDADTWAGLDPFLAANGDKLSPGAKRTLTFLSKLNHGVKIAEEALLKTLAEPDLLCQLRTAALPGQVVKVPLATLSKEAVSCWDADALAQARTLLSDQGIEAPDLAAVAQGGRLFQSRKDPGSDNPYVDQIDVRGVWLDKLLAAKHLSARAYGMANFDRLTGNFLDSRVGVADRVKEILDGALLDSLTAEVTYKDAAGLPVETAVEQFALLPAHFLPAPLPGVAQELKRIIAIPEANSAFAREALNTVRAGMGQDLLASTATREFLQHYAAFRSFPDGQGFTTETVETIDVGLRRYFVPKGGSLGSQLVGKIRELDLFAKVKRPKLLELLEEAKGHKPEGDGPGASAAPPQSDDEKSIVKLGAEKIEAFLNGDYKSREHYVTMLDVLAGT